MSHDLILSLVVLAALATTVAKADEEVLDVVLAVHGGTAGERKNLSAERQEAMRRDMGRALDAGYAVLQRADGTALDAVEAAIRVLENSPEFNAGKGAVFTRQETNELDASIMDGRSGRAGAVAAVTTIKNPISAARAVMEQTDHVLLVGEGAERVAADAGLEIVEPAYFRTERSGRQIEDIWKKEKQHSPDDSRTSPPAKSDPQDHWGTVGAVALDRQGNLAAGTSTGGIPGKLHGRVGDSPIIGAGTYAANGVCAVSATGHGEYFIRYVAAYDIAALMKYKALGVEAAAAEVILGKLKQAGGEGGVIALDAGGHFAAPYNTPGLVRGYATRDGKMHVLLYEN